MENNSKNRQIHTTDSQQQSSKDNHTAITGSEITINNTIEKDLQVKEVLTPQQELRLENLKTIVPDEILCNDLEAAFQKANGNWKETVEYIQQKKEWSETAIKQLVFANAVAELTEDNTALLRKFHENEKINSLRDIALTYNLSQLTDLVRDTNVSTDAEGDTDEQKLKKYTGEVYQKLFQQESTAMVLRMLDDSKSPLFTDKVINDAIRTFLKNQPETFNLKTTSIYEALQREDAFKDIEPEQCEPLTKQLKALQRVAAISPTGETIPVLLQGGFTSAFSVSELPEEQFVDYFINEMGEDGANLAKQVHQTAVNSRIRNKQTLMALNEACEHTGVAENIPTRLKIILGNFALEYEGSESFLSAEVPKLIQQVNDLQFTQLAISRVTLQNNLQELRPVTEMNETNDTIADLTQLMQMRLQKYMDAYTKMFEMLSNALKKASETAESITQNIK